MLLEYSEILVGKIGRDGRPNKVFRKFRSQNDRVEMAKKQGEFGMRYAVLMWVIS